MADLIKLKRGKAKSWSIQNPILQPGEPGFELDTKQFKIGDGTTAWNDLKYIGEHNNITKKTHIDFPSIGKPDYLYMAENENTLYRWDTTKLTYEPFQTGGLTNIELIDGGNASGTA